MATTKKKEDGKVRGVSLAVADEGIMTKAAKALSIDVGKAPTKTGLVTALADYFKEKEKKGSDLMDCDKCGGASTDQLDDCAFCGEGGVTDPDAKPKSEEKAKPKPEEKAKPKPEEKAKPAVDEAPKRKKVKDGASKQTTIETETKAEAPKDAEKKKPDAPKDNVVSIKKNADKLAKKPEEVTGVVLTEDHLNEAVKEINDLKMGAASTVWKLGRKIAEVYDADLYKQRKDAKNKPVYKSFDAFCLEELKMSHASAFEAMKVARQFDEPAVRKFGVTKLALLLRAPEIEQEKILREKIEKGASKTEVAKEVAAAREKHGAPKKSSAKNPNRTKKAREAAAKTSKKKAKVSEKVTIATLLGRHRIALFTAESMKPKTDRKPERATQISQEPCGSLTLINDVGLHISITRDPKKGLVAIVNFKRDEE